MTAQVREPTRAVPAEPVPTGAAAKRSRPSWLLPGLLVAVAASLLVVAGVVSLSAVLYAGLFGGMLLMHVGGHGHGGHGGHGGHADGTEEAADLSDRSPGSQPARPGSVAGLEERASNDVSTGETEDHDRHDPHSCH